MANPICLPNVVSMSIVSVACSWFSRVQASAMTPTSTSPTVIGTRAVAPCAGGAKRARSSADGSAPCQSRAGRPAATARRQQPEAATGCW